MIDQAEHSALLDACPDMLSLHRIDSSFVTVSAACQSLLGRSPETLRGQQLSALIHADDRAMFDARWGSVLSGGEPINLQCRLEQADGGYVWAELRLRRARTASAAGARGDGAEEPQIYCAAEVLAAHSSTEPAYSEPETEQQAARHRDFLTRIMPGMIWYCRMNPDGTLRPASYMSRYLERFAGYSPEQWVSTPNFWASLILPEDKERTLAAMQALPGEGTLPPDRLRALDGRAVWIHSTVLIERSADGVPICLYGVALDVTRYKEAEQQISGLHERLEGLLASIPGVVWERSVDEGERESSTLCSDYVQRLTGYSPKEWMALPSGWLGLTPAPDRAAMAAEWQAAWARGAGVIRHRILARDGQARWIEHHVRVIGGQAGAARYMRGIALDITDRVQMQEERERLRAEVERQAMRIVELSMPLIPVSDEVVVMPLIGAIDAARGGLLISALLSGLLATRANIAVIDVTGVPALDQGSADLIERAARAAQLLGTRVLITGVRPEVAQALIRLAVDLQGIELLGTLRGALDKVLRRRARQAAR